MRSTITRHWLIAASLPVMFLLTTAFTVKPANVSAGQLTYVYQQGKQRNQQTIKASKDPFSYVFSTKNGTGKRADTSMEYSDQHYWYHQDDQGKWVKVAKDAAFSPSGHLLDPDDFSQLLWSFQPQKNWQKHQHSLKKHGSVYVLTSKQKKVLKQSQSLVGQLAPQSGKIKQLTWRWQLKKHRVMRMTYVFKCQHGQVKLIYSHLNEFEQISIPDKIKQAPTQNDDEGRG